MLNLGFEKAQIGSKYRLFTPKTMHNHWLLSLSVLFPPNSAQTPTYIRDNVTDKAERQNQDGCHHLAVVEPTINLVHLMCSSELGPPRFREGKTVLIVL